MTQMSRLTMLHCKVSEGIRDRVALVDRVLEILENRLLSDENASVAGALAERPTGSLGAEKLRNGLAVDRVRFLLHLAELARALDNLLVLILAELRHCCVDRRRTADDDRNELLHR